MIRCYALMALVVLCFVAACTKGGSSGRNAVGQCTGGSDDSSCPGYAEYFACLKSKCESQLTTCYGPDYFSGIPGGLCGSLLQCYAGCKCGDTKCELGCLSKATQECEACVADASQCSSGSGCVEPTCDSADTSEPDVSVGSDATGGTGCLKCAAQSCPDLSQKCPLGVCALYWTCVAKCPESDASCYLACGNSAPNGCKECAAALDSCRSGSCSGSCL